MEKCEFFWWQEGWFITIIPIIAGVLGWIFKTFWESRKPHQRDQEVFQKIKNILDNEFDDNFMGNMKSFVVGSAISQGLIYKLHELNDVTLHKPEYFFLAKKVQTSFQELKNSIKRYSGAFIEVYELKGNAFVTYKPQRHCPPDKVDEMEKLYRSRINELSDAQENFEKSYDNFVIIAQKELYREKITK